MIKISLVEEMQWRLDHLEKCNKEMQKTITKLDVDMKSSIERVYDKLEKYNNMLITSLISSLLTLVLIIFMFISKE